MNIFKGALPILILCHFLLIKASAQESKYYEIDVRINFWKSVSGNLLSVTDSSLVVLHHLKTTIIPINTIELIKIYHYEKQSFLNAAVTIASIGNIIYAITIDDPLTAILVGAVGTPIILATGFFIHKALNPAVLVLKSKKDHLSATLLQEKLAPYFLRH